MIEFPTTEGEVVAIEALIRLPKLEPGHRFRLEQAAYNAVKMTPQYGKRDISRILAPGYRFRIDQLADTLRIGLTVEPKDLGSGLSVLSSVLTEPTFLPDAIKVESMPAISPWLKAIRSFDLVPMEVDQGLLQDIWKYVIRPEAITVGVRGPIPAGRATQLWHERERFWQEYLPNKTVSGRSPKLRLDIGNPPILLFSSQVSVLEPLDIMAATLLSGGKDTILWKVCRESLTMSYQQDAFLIPTSSGWEFKIAIATDKRILEEDAVNQLKSKLLTSVDQLSEADLSHAKGLLTGFFELGQPGIPIRIGNTQLTGGDANEMLFRDLYLAAKSSPPFSSSSWLAGSSLADAKKRLRSIIENSSVSFR
ncbi:MAG: hypothetical protein WCK51_13015 [Armatimonadota bacterium]